MYKTTYILNKPSKCGIDQELFNIFDRQVNMPSPCESGPDGPAPGPDVGYPWDYPWDIPWAWPGSYGPGPLYCERRGSNKNVHWKIYECKMSLVYFRDSHETPLRFQKGKMARKLFKMFPSTMITCHSTMSKYNVYFCFASQQQYSALHDLMFFGIEIRHYCPTVSNRMHAARPNVSMRI
jgi:hypothetical protein